MKRGIHNLAGFCCIFYGNHFLSFADHNCLTAKQALNATKNPNAAGSRILNAWWFMKLCNMMVVVVVVMVEVVVVCFWFEELFTWRLAVLIHKKETRQQQTKHMFSSLIYFFLEIVCPSWCCFMFTASLCASSCSYMHLCNICNHIWPFSSHAVYSMY